MNRRTIERNRKRAFRRELGLILWGQSDLNLELAKTMRKAKERIDTHDERLGIGRPIDSWKV